MPASCFRGAPLDHSWHAPSWRRPGDRSTPGSRTFPVSPQPPCERTNLHRCTTRDREGLDRRTSAARHHRVGTDISLATAATDPPRRGCQQDPPPLLRLGFHRDAGRPLEVFSGRPTTSVARVCLSAAKLACPSASITVKRRTKTRACCHSHFPHSWKLHSRADATWESEN